MLLARLLRSISGRSSCRDCWEALVGKFAGRLLRRIPGRRSCRGSVEVLLGDVAGKAAKKKYWERFPERLLRSIAGKHCWEALLGSIAGRCCWEVLLGDVAEGGLKKH